MPPVRPEDLPSPFALRSPLAFLVLLALLLTTFGCGSGDYRPLAVGEEAVITVVIDSARWAGPVGEALRQTLTADIGTLPSPEPSFGVRAVSITSSNPERIREMKNVVFVAPLNDTTAVARFLKDRLPEGAEIGPNEDLFVVRPDLWRRQQMVVYLGAANPEALIQTIARRGEDLRYVFNEITRKRLAVNMFDRGRQEEIEEQIMEKHGFAVNVQHDYFLAIDTTNFVWLRRVLSDTWRSLFVYYIDNANPSVLSPEWIYATRDSLTKQYITGNLGGWVEIDQRLHLVQLETENVNFLGRYGFETRGLWQMVGADETGRKFQMGGGGPFLTYTFYDEASGRIYMIDGMVFAPGYEKREFLRQMEVIAHTFRTRAETEQVAARK